MTYFSLDNLEFDYRPYPIGIARPVMAPEVYRQFVDAFPPMELFVGYGDMGTPGVKFTLSEKENPENYQKFVKEHPLWREFYRWVKSDDFIFMVLAALRDRHIDVGYDKYKERQPYLRRTLRELRQGRLNLSTPGLTTRFEFSALPADGGFLPPHTDAPSKIITLVFSMADEAEAWDPAWGGQLDVNVPKDERWAYNYHNTLSDFSDMEVVKSFDYQPNQCVVFVKTHDSWHSIRPMQGQGEPALRKTLTIVIEDTARQGTMGGSRRKRKKA
ncbi:2OG-Fe(II) oxygenase [Aquibaculum arenosum]|uniref:2OG-Fe(II) oxygenase n=1 Tax=Aquibaculum arenosum TaxID=3032591 RepID=A0ABT5YHU5_9PROT|nr:2OG-Fe(II) oxygenase [Fodinicurvata sp. CAU 1616]MDF2094360.1 2OG-Fe(II) oxygenase [Fodinicurvata sp. CAU 1616]